MTMHRLTTIGDIEETIAPGFTLPSAREGKPVSLRTFRHRQPVALLFAPVSEHVTALLTHLKAFLHDFREAGSAVLLVSPSVVHDAPHPVLALVDRDRSVFERYGCRETDALCLFALDRFGAVVYSMTCQMDTLPSALRALVDAIAFSEIQCPE